MAYGGVGTYENDGQDGDAGQAPFIFKHLIVKYNTLFPSVCRCHREMERPKYSSEKCFLERTVSRQFGKDEFGIEKKGKYSVEE